jgi:hypothetical protein
MLLPTLIPALPQAKERSQPPAYSRVSKQQSQPHATAPLLDQITSILGGKARVDPEKVASAPVYMLSPRQVRQTSAPAARRTSAPAVRILPLDAATIARIQRMRRKEEPGLVARMIRMFGG